MRQLNHQTMIKCEQMIRSSQALTEFVSVSEKYRKRFSEKLRESLAECDVQNNQIFELNQNKKLSEIQTELVERKLNMIFESVGEITSAKNLEDKYQVEIDRQKEEISTLQGERQAEEYDKNRIIKEKDQHRDDARE